ncbi:hypothetical protein NG895_09390 [Aeoliella sp. ICT_H6.2]|uniref:Uncharacterized protein n=1 Tax=Aeoliella straminimaris TaxID=2954799 RepID=A0A9X2F855_9BACT|nr:hypothetical protein [Aeoliella straminimaris]MCO6044120.1 hypothetical protein [Aeoliella straminimaris]
MDTPIVSCQCGAKMRVPAQAVGRAIRCPKCKSRIDVPDPATAVPIATQAIDLSDASECPICQTKIAPGEPTKCCQKCEQLHHLDCWDEVGGCSTYGCENAPAPEEEKAAQTPLSAWGDTKKCPACGEMIKAIAVRCRYCQTEFDSVDPLSVADLRRQAGKQAKTDSSKQVIVGIFVLSMVGCLAPVMLAISLAYVLRNRETLAKAGPLFVIMGWIAVALSGVYSLLMAFFLLIGG